MNERECIPKMETLERVGLLSLFKSDIIRTGSRKLQLSGSNAGGAIMMFEIRECVPGDIDSICELNRTEMGYNCANVKECI